jgi:hypothetical protein
VGDVTVLVLHPPLASGAGPLTAALDAARRELGARHRAGFLGAGAVEVALVEEARDEPFGARLRRLADSITTPGLVVLGSGALALARAADYRAFVEAAASNGPRALANNRFSADAVALSRAAVLQDLPDLPSDNALPRWLEEVAGWPVADLRGRSRLAVDLDSPADVAIAGRALPAVVAHSPYPSMLAAIQSVMADRRLELTVAGRTSTGTLAELERRAACRVRALVEERGLRAASRLAQAPPGLAGSTGSTEEARTAERSGRHRETQQSGRDNQTVRDPRPRAGPARHPASILGLLLERDGPGALGRILARLGDGAVVDSRVLLAHRLGADEAAWPVAEDRFASDLLLPDHVGDPWLRALTASAAAASIPVLLGGHTLVGPGLRILAERLR